MLLRINRGGWNTQLFVRINSINKSLMDSVIVKKKKTDFVLQMLTSGIFL